jgi:hypothetical protein
VISTDGISQDGKWLIAYARYTRPGQEPEAATMAFPLTGRPGIRVFGPGGLVPLMWYPDLLLLFFSTESFYGGVAGKTYVIPLAAGRLWPELPLHGFAEDVDIAKLPGVRTNRRARRDARPVGGCLRVLARADSAKSVSDTTAVSSRLERSRSGSCQRALATLR